MSFVARLSVIFLKRIGKSGNVLIWNNSLIGLILRPTED